MLMLVACPSSAIQLQWNSGSPNLTFTSATRCTLIVRADSAEVRLPSEWRLLWIADSSLVQFVAVDSLDACLLDEAQVSRIEGSATAADSAANLITAHFCSAGSNPALAAQYILDLSAGGHGNLKAVALDPTDPDSSRVIESNEVTYNGGVDGAYAPVILHASSIHQSLQLEVTAVGSGLLGAGTVSIAAPNGSWSLPLEVSTRSDSAVTAGASVAALLPACEVSVASTGGAASAASLPADGEPAPLTPAGLCAATYNEHLLPPPPNFGFAILPKDFAFAFGFVGPPTNKYAFHLLYIRRSLYNIPGDENEKNIGHTWTTDFITWKDSPNNPPDTVALTVRAGKFDELHVWAPTIVQRGPTFWMYYTGVRIEENPPGVFRRNQRIGVATSTDLNTWTPVDAVVLSAPQIPWASRNPTAYDGQQLRDPFVMEDPIHPGQWLMYFVAVDSMRAPKMSVGVARSTDLLNWTADQFPLRSTQKATFQGTTNIVESPHLFQRNGNWWLPYTVNNNQVFFETNGGNDPTDTTVVHWSGPVWLEGVVEGNPPTLDYWHATEYLRINGIDYLAAYNDNVTGIDISEMLPPSPLYAQVDSFALSCPHTTGVRGPGPTVAEARLVVSRLSWGAPEVGLRLELPARMPVRLAVYDIAGRRRRTLLDRELAGGVTEVAWDGRDETGARVASGMYFIRMSCAKGTRLSKVVLLR